MSAVRRMSYEAVPFQGGGIILSHPYQALPEVLIGWFIGVSATVPRPAPTIVLPAARPEREFDAKANFDFVTSLAFCPLNETLDASAAALERLAARADVSDEEWADTISADLARFND